MSTQGHVSIIFLLATSFPFHYTIFMIIQYLLLESTFLSEQNKENMCEYRAGEEIHSICACDIDFPLFATITSIVLQTGPVNFLLFWYKSEPGTVIAAVLK